MPINNITQTISTIPPAGARGVDVQTQFVIKQEDFQDHLQGTTVTELNTLKDQLNSRIGEINSTVTTMNGYANTASAGASTATTKAGEASISVGEALAYRNQTETFKNNASTSATKASQWADYNYNVAVETGRYSAKHWSTVAQNATANKVDKVTSTDNAIVRFDGTTGQVQNSAIIIDDNGNIGSGTQSFNGFGGGGFKNYIINGNFDIWQRGNSFNSIGYYTADRTTSNGDGTGAVSISKQTFSAGDTSVVGAKNYYRFQRTTAGSGSTWTNAYVQNIEELQRFAGKTLTISFWVKNSINSNIYINIQWGYGTGGSSTEGYQYTVPSTTSWTKVSRTFTVPTFSGKTFGANSCMGINISPNYQLNSVYTLDIAQVQLEEGSVATPFEQRPIGLELSLCQRYYEIIAVERILCSNDNVNSWFGATVTSYWKSTKRVTPTVTLINWSGTMTAVPTPSAFGLGEVLTTPSVQAATNQYGQFGLIGSAEL